MTRKLHVDRLGSDWKLKGSIPIKRSRQPKSPVMRPNVTVRFVASGTTIMPTKGAPTPDEFIALYERALASQGWPAVDPLVHDDACVTFSNGTVHVGKAAVQRAFESNFAAIADEEYRISNMHWVHRGSEIARTSLTSAGVGAWVGEPRAVRAAAPPCCIATRTDGGCSWSTWARLRHNSSIQPTSAAGLF